MKQINIIILFLMGGLFLSSCHDDQSAAGFQPLDYYVKVKASTYNVNFNRHGALLTPESDGILLTISPANEELELSTSDSWCHAEIIRSGDNVLLKITADANDGEQRTAKVYAMAGKGADKSGAIINITQETAFIIPTITVNSNVVIFDKYGGTETITITTNLEEWDYQVTNLPGEAGNTDWLSVVKDNDKLTLNAPDAGSIDLREVQVVITAADGDLNASTTVKVTQDKNRKMVAGIEFILVEGGTFLRGANSGDVGYVATLATTNSPKHSVTLSDYYIGKFEITQKQYYDIMGTNPSRWPWANYQGPDNDQYDPARSETAMYGNYPVEQITWAMAVAFCEKLNDSYSDQGTFSIPTEAQWEYAARGGKHINEANRVRYSGSDNAAAVGNNGAGAGTEANNRTKPVGQYQPNELGIHDMTGNVLEHVWDFFAAYPSGPVTDPTGPAQQNTTTGTTGAGLHHIFRGGSYWHAPYTVFQRAGNANVNYIGNGLMGMRIVFKRNP
ncbi:MAG TPA: SUMF1/EgtB/PvdO family nonheme iron enzyme [Sphingobacterium sp.]|nr:SUMF1/EgtB/PvdO family nonheme iron enzyme [Sphingobacterium sp.]